MTAAMTRDERENLQRLVRQREKVLKSAAKQRSAELIADFENQMGSTARFGFTSNFVVSTRFASIAFIAASNIFGEVERSISRRAADSSLLMALLLDFNIKPGSAAGRGVANILQ
jgi:hypothetical protein